MADNDHASRIEAQLRLDDRDQDATPDRILVDDLVDVCLDADATDEAVLSATLEEVNEQLSHYRSGLSVESALLEEGER
jgi:hypothetical protein